MLRLTGTMVLGLMVMTLLGCGGPKSTLDTVPVSGLVTLDGAPVDGAMVVFAPTSGSGTAASGKTDATGRYKLTTQEPGDGALPGSYLVMISKSAAEDATAGAVKPGMTDEEATKAAAEARDKTGGAEPTVKELLPAMYKDPAKSGLKAEVAKGGQTEFNFELKSAGSAAPEEKK